MTVLLLPILIAIFFLVDKRERGFHAPFRFWRVRLVMECCTPVIASYLRWYLTYSWHQNSLLTRLSLHRSQAYLAINIHDCVCWFTSIYFYDDGTVTLSRYLHMWTH
ncbi:hypothetical protein BDZ97DRAFT_566758 [Flammula alnicola]|nr:hypothetical protein BDZ97DRAFT_566758 [Flammula alnicola]